MGDASDAAPMMVSSARSGPACSASALLLGRAASALLSVSFLILLVYTCATDGSPFRSALLTPWMSTTLVDYYLSLLPFYFAVFMRERYGSGAGAAVAALWVLFCAGLGACAVWLYVFVVLMRARPGVSVASLITGGAA
jgi:hypothetical protein